MVEAPASAEEAGPEELGHVTSAADRFVRADHIEAGYSPWAHIGRTVGIASVIAVGALVLAVRARPLDWALLPIFYVVANLIEWTVHRYPMHRPMWPRILYRNHALNHHLAFTDQKMAMHDARELTLIMMPWYTMIGLFVVASPVMVLAAVVRGPGLAGVFLLGAVAYFLSYEALHAAYHLSAEVLERLGLARLAPFRALQVHHRHHHILRRMAHVNFNVTVPLMDHLLGTNERDGEEPSRA
jgi:hypothetical protein